MELWLIGLIGGTASCLFGVIVGAWIHRSAGEVCGEEMSRAIELGKQLERERRK